MNEPDGSGFFRVLSSFRNRLSSQDMDAFRLTTFDDLKQAIADIQREQAKRRGFRNLNKIRPFLNGLGQYAQVIEVFVNAKPDILACIWGPIKLCLQIASKVTEAFDALLDAYERIGKSFPSFAMIDQLFYDNAHVQQVLVNVYEDILEFHKRSVVFFKQSTWKLAFKLTLHTFGDMFGDVLKKLERSKELLLQSANIAHFHEAQEARQLFSMELEALSERTKEDRMLTVVDWLSPVSCSVDHEELQAKRHEFPQTTRWIFKQSTIREWLQTDDSTKCMLWICGIPGAGKTVLFSSIVDEIQVSMPQSQVIYFYCKNRDPSRRSFDAVARSFVAQLLHLNPVSLDYLHQLAVESGERHPSTFKTYQDILENISLTHSMLFIGIDGLDECEEQERQLILQLMSMVLRVSSPQANVKIFLTSQRMKDIKESLRSVVCFDIKHHHVRQDIQDYIRTRSSRLCKKFGFDFEKQASITKDISSRPNGMFLLARLIMDNLMDQDSIEDLEEELCTDTLPSGIDEAYGRILGRLRKCRTEKSQQRITRVLEIILTARRPLRVQELQGALSIRIEDESVDFMRRKSLTPFNELCGPLLEVHSDDIVSLVHPTAKQYLIQHHSGPYINILAAELRMANLCAAYLTFEIFSATLQETDLRGDVSAGAFAFQEYATLYWLDHSTYSGNLDTRDNDGEVASLNRVNRVLALRHVNSEFEPDLARLKASYEAVDSLSESTKRRDSMLYLLHLITRTRSVIEELWTTKEYHVTSLAEAYGAAVFKCSVIACPQFQHGFKSREQRNKHQQTHRSRLLCNYQGCDYSVLGFSTSQALAKHIIEHDSRPPEISFPKVQRSSVIKALETAIDQNNFTCVRSLSTDVSNLPSRDNGFLLQAVKKRNLEALRALLPTLGDEQDVEFQDKQGMTAIHYVAENGDEEMAKLIIGMGADINARIKGKTNRDAGVKDYPLKIAASRGHPQIVRLLVNNVTRNKQIDSEWCKTPLQVAAQGGHIEVLRILLDADGAAYAQHTGYYKAVKSAASKKHEPAVRLLLERGFELNAGSRYPQALSKLIPEGIDSMVAHVMQEIDGNGKTKGNILQSAAAAGKSEKVLRLLEDGADINHFASGRGTALAAAAGSGHLSIVQRLIEFGANVNAKPGERGSALQQAVYCGHLKIVTLLLEHQADVNLQHAIRGFSLRRGMDTSLKLAIHFNHIDIVKLLLQHGANVNGGTGETQLQLAIRFDYQEIVEILSEHGASLIPREENNDELNQLTNEDYHLDHASLDWGDVLENFDFDSFLQATHDADSWDNLDFDSSIQGTHNREFSVDPSTLAFENANDNDGRGNGNDTEDGDVLENFDFDSFLQSTADRGFNFDPSTLAFESGNDNDRRDNGNDIEEGTEGI